jgi:hypothetical protein
MVGSVVVAVTETPYNTRGFVAGNCIRTITQTATSTNTDAAKKEIRFFIPHIPSGKFYRYFNGIDHVPQPVHNWLKQQQRNVGAALLFPR